MKSIEGDNQAPKCPGCGAEIDSDEPWDHLGQCDFPREEKMQINFEARCLLDPKGLESHMLVEESRSVYIDGASVVGEIRNCKFGGVEYVDRVNHRVWYIGRATMIAAFAKALKARRTK